MSIRLSSRRIDGTWRECIGILRCKPRIQYKGFYRSRSGLPVWPFGTQRRPRHHFQQTRSRPIYNGASSTARAITRRIMHPRHGRDAHRASRRDNRNGIEPQTVLAAQQIQREYYRSLQYAGISCQASQMILRWEIGGRGQGFMFRNFM